MNQPWTTELVRFLTVSALALLFGAIFSQPLPFLLISTLAYLLWHLRNLLRLSYWLSSGSRQPPPESVGIWGEIFHEFYRMQRRDRARKKRLTAMLSRFKAATSALPDATVVINSSCEIEWFNDAAKLMLDLRSPTDTGQRLDNLIRHPDFVHFMAQSQEQVQAGEEGTLSPVLIPSPVHSETTLSVQVVPFGNHQRLVIASDVSQQQRLEQLRRDFVANVSHELRTPLTVITGYLETLQDDDELDPFVQQPLLQMQQQAERMRQIVEDLLMLSRLERDRAQAPYYPVELPQLLDTLGETARQLSNEKGHTVTVECPPGARLFCMEKEIYSAFSNLVSNAVRYTPPGGRIAITWYEDERGGHFAVRDSGEGIPPHHLPRLTERFYRVDVGRSRQAGGTGLGLAIVKHVMSHHQGALHIESEMGRGSLFRCDFPPERLNEAEPQALLSQNG